MAQIYISLGSNLDAEKYLQAGLKVLTKIFGALVQSSVYESEAVGFQSSNYLNMVVCARTYMSVTDTVKRLKQIELDHGRLPNAKKLAPRTLDLDLLLYDDLVIDAPIVLPRIDIIKYAFVLWPLMEIAPNKLHPLLKQTYASMWNDFNCDRQKIWRLTQRFAV